MRTLLLLLSLVASMAADPQQPKVGNKEVVQVNTGYADSLTVRTQLNLTGVLNVTGAGRITGAFTNDAIQPVELVIGGADKTLGSVAHGNAGEVLTSNGNGVAPSFQPSSGGDTIWTTNVNGTIQATSAASGNDPLLALHSSDGTNWASIYPHGEYIGADTTALNAIIGAVEGAKFGYVSDLTLPGRTAPWGIFVGSVLDAASRVGTWVAIDSFDTNSVAMELGWYGPVYNNLLNFTGSATSGSTLDIESGGITGVRFEPSVVDGSTPFKFDTSTNHTSGNLLELKNHSDATKEVDVTWDGGLRTAKPSGGTNAVPFKMGEHVAGTFSLVTTNAVLIEINGVTYKLATVQ